MIGYSVDARPEASSSLSREWFRAARGSPLNSMCEPVKSETNTGIHSDEELMRTQRYTTANQARSSADDQAGSVTWFRSMSCVEMMRAGAIILNEALILASSIFDR